MRIRAAWTVEIQALADNADVIAVAEAAVIPGALGTIASIISKHANMADSRFESALAGANMLLPTQLQAASNDEGIRSSEEQAIELAGTITDTVRRLYANATDQADLNKRRAKVVELTLYRRVSRYYAAGECMADCLVEPTVDNEYFNDIAGREFDLCAWSEPNLQGEAYECAMRPDNLEYRDCRALINLWYAVAAEHEGDDIWFRMGLVSFHLSKYMHQRVKMLAGSNLQDQEEFGWLSLYGYDNLSDVNLDDMIK